MFLKVMRGMRSELYECSQITVEREQGPLVTVLMGGQTDAEMQFNLGREDECAAWVMNDQGDTVETVFTNRR